MKLHIKTDTRQTTDAFAALGDPTRRRIVELLADGEAQRVSELVQAFDSARQTVTRHLDVLASAGITTTEWRGRERYTSLSADAFDSMKDWFSRYDRFWDSRLENLKKLVEKGQSQ